MVSDKNEYRKMVLDKNEYRKAAKRHLDTCRYMLDHLGEVHSADNYEENNILMDIYYLSGYIIECAGSFGMLCLGQKITWTDTDKDGTERERAIHNFQNNFIKPIDQTCKDQGFDLNLWKLTKDSELYSEWRVNVRYETKLLDLNGVKKFVELSGSIYELITRHEKKLIDLKSHLKGGK